jgi:predicted lipid-binding transport protein (Tim44 family)
MRPLACLLALVLLASHAHAQAGRYSPVPRSSSSGGHPIGGGHPIVHLLPGEKDWPFVLVCGLVGGVIGLIYWLATRQSSESTAPRRTGGSSHGPRQAGDVLRSPQAVAAAAEQTLARMKQLAQADPAWAPEPLQRWGWETFCNVQRCWAQRDYTPLRGVLAPGLWQRHKDLLDLMTRNRERNPVEQLQLSRWELIELRRGEGVEEVVALITFSAVVYFVDEAGGYLRGARQPCLFQEAWTFRKEPGRWIVQGIQRSHEYRPATTTVSV